MFTFRADIAPFTAGNSAKQHAGRTSQKEYSRCTWCKTLANKRNVLWKIPKLSHSVPFLFRLLNCVFVLSIEESKIKTYCMHLECSTMDRIHSDHTHIHKKFAISEMLTSSHHPFVSQKKKMAHEEKWANFSYWRVPHITWNMSFFFPKGTLHRFSTCPLLVDAVRS